MDRVTEFERFTPGARSAMQLANQAALEFRHPYIGTEHIVLGLLREGDGSAAQVLLEAGLTLEAARDALVSRLGRGEYQSPGEPDLAPHAGRVLEHAREEADALKHPTIGTEHILLGLLSREMDVGDGLLTDLKLDLAGLRFLLRAHATPTMLGPSSLQLDDFDEHARQAVRMAIAAAYRFNHERVGTEHLLLGVVDERHGRAAEILAELGFEPSKVRQSVEFIMGQGRHTTSAEPDLTVRAHRVLESARRESKQFRCDLVGTEHLLLGILLESDGLGAGVLASLGVTTQRVRARLATDLEATILQSGAVVTSAGEHMLKAQWEYLVLETVREEGGVRVSRLNEQEAHRFSSVSLHWTLQVLGDETWELVGIDAPRGRDEGGTVYVFKRRKSTALESR